MVTANGIRALIQQGDARVLSNMVIALYHRQVADEKNSNQTHHSNMVGFNKPDARKLTIRAKHCLKLQSPMCEQWMIADTMHRIMKYAGQLADIVNTEGFKPYFPKPKP